MGRPGCDDQKVVLEDLLLRNDLPLFQLEIDHFFKQHFNVGVRSKYPADGRRYIAGREASGSDLVEQRLEGMVVFPVNDGNLNGETGDPAGGGQARESSPHNHHPRSRLAVCWHWLYFFWLYYRDSQNGYIDALPFG